MKITTSTISITRILFVGLFLTLSFFANAQSESSKSEPVNQGELEQILAPIALYPDTILSHILVAATYPLEVVQAERWATGNPQLKGAEAVEAVEDQEWDPSVRALVAFPQILQRMSEDLDWTQQLGDAFLEDEEQLLASVQSLRELAEQAGSLDEMQQVSVVRDDKTIIIEPREREVVYVPYYDTRVVYGPWRWQQYQPIFWDYPYYDGYSRGSYYSRNRHSSFFWGPRVSLSFGFFFNTFHWQNRHLVRISSRHYRPNRYYSHSDILGHGYAERWVHNSGRRYGSHTRNRINRHGRSQQRIGSQSRVRQERVREGLANNSSNVRVRGNDVQRNRSRSRYGSTRHSRGQLDQPVKRTDVEATTRGTRADEPRRSNSRYRSRETVAQRPYRASRSAVSQRSTRSQGSYGSQRSNNNVAAQRQPAAPQLSRPAPQASRAAAPANRPARQQPQAQPQVQQRQAQSRPVQSRQRNNPPQSSQSRQGPHKARSAPRQERRRIR